MTQKPIYYLSLFWAQSFQAKRLIELNKDQKSKQLSLVDTYIILSNIC